MSARVKVSKIDISTLRYQADRIKVLGYTLDEQREQSALRIIPADKVPALLDEIETAKAALLQTGITGIYDDFDGLADAIQQLACYALEQKCLAAEYMAAFCDVADIVDAPEMWTLDGLHLVTDKVREMEAEHIATGLDFCKMLQMATGLNETLRSKDRIIAEMKLKNEKPMEES